MDLLDLVERDTKLKRVASTRGGEWQGPCPWCGGVDRFWVHPYHDPPEYQCRQCGRKGDDIGYLRDHDGMTFLQACAYLGLDPKDPRGNRAQDDQLRSAPVPRLHAEAPNSVWQARATEWCRQAVACLWGEGARPHATTCASAA